MKRLLVTVGAVILPLLSLSTSCVAGEKSPGKSGNYIYVGGTEYVIKEGFAVIFEGQDGDAGGDSNIVLVSDGLSYDLQTGNFEGDGFCLFFEMSTPSEQEGIEDGVYKYYFPVGGRADDPVPDFTFSDASSYSIIWGDNYIRDHFMEGSTITVRSSNARYTIKIEGQTYSAGNVSGTFTGMLGHYLR